MADCSIGSGWVPALSWSWSSKRALPDTLSRRGRGSLAHPSSSAFRTAPRKGLHDGPNVDEVVLISTGSLPHPIGSSRRKQEMTVERGMARKVVSDDKHRQRQRPRQRPRVPPKFCSPPSLTGSVPMYCPAVFVVDPPPTSPHHIRSIARGIFNP